MTLRRLVIYEFLLLIFIVASATMYVPSSANAADYCSKGGRGRGGCVGYFNGEKANPNDGVGNVVTGGLHVSSADAFIDTVMGYYNSSGQNRNGGAFIINVMMGYDGPGEGLTIPDKVINDWKDRVRYYEKKGWVDWNKNYFKPDGSRNSAYFNGIKDPAFHAQNGSETQAIIEFNGPGAGNVVRIQRSCGNFLGDIATLDKPKPKATINPSAGPDLTVNVGQSVTFTHWVNVTDDEYTGDDTFSWSISDPGATSGTTRISGPNRRVDKTYTTSFDTRGPRTKTLSIDSAPGYATIKSGGTQKVTVNGWDIKPKSLVDGVARKTVIVGQSVTFTHQLKSEGAPLHKNVDGDVVIAAGSSSMPQCSAGGTDSPECWKYRFTDTDLTPADSDQTASRAYTFNQVGTYCEQLSYNPNADNDGTPTLYDYPNYSKSTAACVDVIDPTPTASSGAEYEKGGPGVDTNVGVKFDGPCPAVEIVINWLFSVPDLGLNNVARQAKYGGASGCADTSEPIPLGAYAAILNSKAPGTTYGTVSSIPATGESTTGQFSVIEVPFAKFYGNDIYATNGEIRFNDAGDPNTAVQRGSVNQYAALSFGNVQIDTSSFRTLPIAAPNPPNGLDVANVGADLNRIKATSVYEDVKNNLPTNCTQIDSGGLNTPQNGCYIIQATTSATPTNLPPPDNKAPAWSTSNGGIPVLGWGDLFGAGVTTYNKKVTISNPTDKMLMIVGDIVNNSSYADPSSAGVLLIVSQGPIVIDNNVRRVDAILVSKSGIYTCGIAGFGPLLKKPQNGIHQTCREPLNINGAISAPTIDFRRAVGSRYLNASGGDEQQNCQISKGIQNCDTRGTNLPNNTGATAEIVNFPTYLYFAKPFLRDTTASGADTDAIFVAPPRL
jgi:hypothetical protein